jgi:hypothetical protein
MQSLPFILEDRTGQLTGSDFDDIYDRMFLRVARQPRTPSTVIIYKMGRRSSSRRDSLPHQHQSPFHPHSSPSARLEYGPQDSLGYVSFQQGAQMPMHRYLRKTSIFGGSLSRKFTASDGREYRWSYQSVPEQEWSCVANEGFVVAHYDLKPPNTRAYDVSGNVLTVYEPFAHLVVELLASLTIMRHIAEHNL